MLLSIVICTFNRASKITACLDSVHASLKHAGQLNSEIVIINNNSNDNTIEVVSQWAKSSDFPTNLTTEEEQGIAWARNKSFLTAKGKLLISIDDDCTMHVDYIKNVLNAYKDDQEPILRFGQLDLGNINDWPMTTQTRPYIKKWKLDNPDYDYITMGNICSANMIIPRAIIDDVGLYDTRFGTKEIPGGEDADFGFRAFHAGYLMEYRPEIIAYHYHGRNTKRQVKKIIKNYSIAAGALFTKHHLRHPRLMGIFDRRNTETDIESKYQDDIRLHIIQKYHKTYKVFYIQGLIMFIWLTLKQFMNNSSNEQ